MHRRRSRIVVLAGAALTILLAACSTSRNLGPTQPASQALANHFDTIYTNLVNEGSDTDLTIADMIAIGAELSPGFSGVSSPVTVTTAGGAAAWSGVAYEIVTAGGPFDSAFITFVYNDPAVDQAVLTETNYTGGTATGNAYIILNASSPGSANVFFDSSYTGAGSVISTGRAGSCSLTGGINAANSIDSTLLTVQDTTTCQPAKLQTSFTAGFFAADSLGALTTASIPSTTFTGVRLTGNFPQSSRVVVSPRAAKRSLLFTKILALRNALRTRARR
jgi:hypothetical protein